MNREEAIDVLKAYLMFDKSSQQVAKALNMAIEALSAEPTVIIRSRTLMPTKDFKEWAKRVRETNPNAVVIPCDAEVVSAEAEQVTGKLKNPCNSLLADDVEECKEQKSKLDLISREDAIDTIEYWYGINVSEAINRLPSADRPKGEDWDKYSEKLWKSAYERGLKDQSKFEEVIEKLTNYRNAVAEEHTDDEAELLDPEDWYYDDGYLNALNYALSILEEAKYEYGTSI